MADPVSAPTSTPLSFTGKSPDGYSSHSLHSPSRNYQETNCYTDILIELLHARGLEPLAAMGIAVRMDFEGDQWTFLKPAPYDLELLFGLDIHEMQPYRPLPEQAAELIEAGSTLIVELDSWYLPDTSGTSYGAEHVKSSVVVDLIDPARERMRYFHAVGLYELAGEDYRGVFRLGRDFSDDVLPPYTEIARFDAGALQGEELRDAARAQLRAHLAKRPSSNPFVRFGERLELDLPRLLDGDVEMYHAYAFATVRMAGSAFEALSSHAVWLLGEGAAPSVEAIGRIVESCKSLSFRLARRKPFDSSEAIATLAGAWEQAMDRLERV